MDPENPGTLFVAMWQYRRQPWFFDSGLYGTHDGDENWTELEPGSGLPRDTLGCIALAIAPGNPARVHACVEED
jgi:hypothetical protein